MNIRTINATANNLIKALEIDLEKSDNVARMYADLDNPLTKHADYDKRKKEIDNLIERHNQQVDNVYHTLVMLYITALDDCNLKKLEKMQNKVKDLRMVDIYVIEG